MVKIIQPQLSPTEFMLVMDGLNLVKAIVSKSENNDMLDTAIEVAIDGYMKNGGIAGWLVLTNRLVEMGDAANLGED